MYLVTFHQCFFTMLEEGAPSHGAASMSLWTFLNEPLRQRQQMISQRLIMSVFSESADLQFSITQNWNTARAAQGLSGVHCCLTARRSWVRYLAGVAPFCVHVLPEFAWDSSGYSGFLPQSKDVRVYLALAQCQPGLAPAPLKPREG